ncbi:MAG: hypothetical protein FWB93_03010, partial [Oscillospiraceae bacterium]|nr:hypothetical protein [Oscillospiraceae bacterium]
ATLAAAVLEKFVDIRRRLATRDFMNEYRHRSVLIGKEVTVYGTQQYHATVVGIDDDCGLIVNVGGETRTISAGEVSVRNTHHKSALLNNICNH